MADFYREGTHRTPFINGDKSIGLVQIKGISLPEDAREFYFPFRDWLFELYKSDIPEISFLIELEYFNTGTSKIIIDILLSLEKIKTEKVVSVIWSYEEDDIEMEQTGKDFIELLGNMVVLKPKPFESN